MKVLISGGRSPYTLDLIRSLKSKGYKIIAVEFFKYHLSFYSRYVDKAYVISAPNIDLNKFNKQMVDLVCKNRIDLFIPTCEEIFHVSRLKDELEQYTEVFCDPFDKLEQLHHKKSFIDILEKKNILHPRTYCLHEYDNELYSEDVILKRKYSRFGNNIHRINERSLEKSSYGNLDEWIIQERIYGQEISLYTVVYRGNIQAISAYKKEYSIDSGATILFQNFEHEKINEFVEKFFENTQHHGQFSFDLIMDEREEIYPIECNPRSTSGIHLLSSDPDFASCFFKKGPLVQPTLASKSMLSLAMILYGREGKCRKTWKKDFFTSKDVVFRWDDIGPSLFQFVSFMHFLIIAVKNRISIVEATTLDIEFNGEN